MEISLAKLADFARDFVAALPTQAGSRAHIVGLRGDLGAGKTTLVQEVARVLGVTHPVTSPTFVIAERYAIQHPPFTSLIHIDAYRITENEVPTIGWTEFTADPKNLVLVEWPENLGNFFPKNATVLELSVVDESTRTITHA